MRDREGNTRDDRLWCLGGSEVGTFAQLLWFLLTYIHHPEKEKKLLLLLYKRGPSYYHLDRS
jgi:hypothetical protein